MSWARRPTRQARRLSYRGLSILFRRVGGLVGFADFDGLVLFVEFALHDFKIAPGHRIVLGLEADGEGEFFGGWIPGLELDQVPAVGSEDVVVVWIEDERVAV